MPFHFFLPWILPSWNKNFHLYFHFPGALPLSSIGLNFVFYIVCEFGDGNNTHLLVEFQQEYMTQTRKINIIRSTMTQWRGRTWLHTLLLLKRWIFKCDVWPSASESPGMLYKKVSSIVNVKCESLRDGVLKSACSTGSICDSYSHYSLRMISQENIKVPQNTFTCNLLGWF